MTYPLLNDLPGQDLVEKGLADQQAGVRSIESCLVEMASPRLARAGILKAASQAEDSETTLYSLLQEQNPNQDVYPTYNSLLRRIVSFERALDHRLQKSEPISTEHRRVASCLESHTARRGTREAACLGKQPAG